jgi:hypothetical protein
VPIASAFIANEKTAQMSFKKCVILGGNKTIFCNVSDAGAWWLNAPVKALLEVSSRQKLSAHALDTVEELPP